jgi:hypothetical protein
VYLEESGSEFSERSPAETIISSSLSTGLKMQKQGKGQMSAG